MNQSNGTPSRNRNEPTPDKNRELNIETQKQYIRTAQSLIGRFEDEWEINDWVAHQGQLIEWMDDARYEKEWTKTTYHCYRRSLHFYLKHHDQIVGELIEKLEGLDSSPLSSKSTKTQAVRMKHWPEAMYKRFHDDIRSLRKTKWGRPLLTWVDAGIFTGLRPTEWWDTELIIRDNEWVLIVDNAKQHSEWSHGPTRTLRLTNFDGNSWGTVRSMIELVKQYTYDEMYYGCQRLMHRRTREIWPDRDRYPSLKSSRHQFCANAKSSNIRPDKIAATLGHKKDVTAMETYGWKKSGQGVFMVKPDPDDVEKVQSEYENNLDKLENELSINGGASSINQND